MPERAIHDRLAREPLDVTPASIPVPVPAGGPGRQLATGAAGAPDAAARHDTHATGRQSWASRVSSLLGLGQHTVLSGLSQRLVLAVYAPLPEGVATG